MIATQQTIFGTWAGTDSKIIHSTANEVINAYLEGRKVGKAEASKEMFDTLFSNLKTAQEISETLLESINQSGIVCRRVYLKIDNIDSFSVMLQIAPSVFYSDQIDNLYHKAFEMRKAKNIENFSVSFSFLPSSQYLNEDRISSDGYVLTYETNIPQAG
jgi:hypothetical protein